jgi:predicted GIY-YIG superfamily endonuclease
MPIKLTQNKYDEVADKIDCIWVDPYQGAHTPSTIRCNKCEFEWKVRVYDARRASGCKRCGPKRFKNDEPAYLYLMEDGKGAVKVGVTGKFQRRNRISKLSAYGWKLVDCWEFDRGEDAHKIEQEILSWWRDDLDLPPAYEGEFSNGIRGTSETVDTSKISKEEIIKRIEGLI